jgi:hypothetical protein
VRIGRGPRRPVSAEDELGQLGEAGVQTVDDGHDHQDEDDDRRRVGGEVIAARPDDLAELGDDLAVEEAGARKDVLAVRVLLLLPALARGLVARLRSRRERPSPCSPSALPRSGVAVEPTVSVTRSSPEDRVPVECSQ